MVRSRALSAVQQEAAGADKAGHAMTESEVRACLRELAVELPGLRQAEEQVEQAVAEAWLLVQDLDREAWTGSGRGRLDLAIQEWRRVQGEHQVAMAALERNLREGGKLRRMLEQMEVRS
jgi:hypothetical protein